MKKLFIKILQKLIIILRKDDVRIQQKKESIEWKVVDGDNTLRLNYNLKPSSTVFDIGGYRGQWSSDIFAKYLCRVYVFEPFPEFYKDIQERFKNNEKVTVYSFGLGNKDTLASIYFSADGTSLYASGNDSTKIELREFNRFIKEEQIHEIDLIKINIEGAEYDLLDYLTYTETVKKIKNIQVQFHNKYVENPEKRMIAIQQELKKTHELTWQYKFVWENWERKF